MRLALSLHAADEALRSELMPVNERYPLADVLEACRAWHAARRRAGVRRVPDARRRERPLRAGAGAGRRARAAARLQGQPDPLQPHRRAVRGLEPRGDRRRSGRRSRSAGCGRRCGLRAGGRSQRRAGSSPPPGQRRPLRGSHEPPRISTSPAAVATREALVEQRDAVDHREARRHVGHERRLGRADRGDQVVEEDERDAGAEHAERRDRRDGLRARAATPGAVSAAAGRVIRALSAIVAVTRPTGWRPGQVALEPEARRSRSRGSPAAPCSPPTSAARAAAGVDARAAARRRPCPRARPASARPCERSSWSTQTASSAVKIGAEATRMPASDEAISCWPTEISDERAGHLHERQHGQRARARSRRPGERVRCGARTGAARARRAPCAGRRSSPARGPRARAR